MPGLRTQPWLDPRRFAFARTVEEAFPDILAELTALGADAFGEYPGAGLAGWREFALCFEDRVQRDHAARCPRTAAIVPAIRADRGYVNQLTLLTLAPGTTLLEHVDPHNYLVSVHLPLVVPARTGLRVAGESRPYVASQCLAFDNSFVHSAWNHGKSVRIVLAIQTFHPALTPTEVRVMKLLHPELALGGRTSSDGRARTAE